MKLTRRTMATGAAAMTLVLLLSSCIKDDIPYPHIQANFLAITAEGQSAGARIDSINRTVHFTMEEDANIYEVRIADYKITPDAEVVGDVLSQPIDLSEPLDVTLHLYYDYKWTFTATQNIERYFTVEGQIGSSTIDVAAKRVIAYVSTKADVGNLKVNTIKLGAGSATMSPELEGKTVDFRRPVQVIVTNYGHREVWTIFIDQTDAKVTTEGVDAWTNVAWVYGQGEVGADFGVQYRIAGDSEWTTVPKSWLTVDGGSFHARLIHLSEQTEYEARVSAGSDYGESVKFTTGTSPQVPNSNFENWWLDGKVWCPWAEGGEPYWGTGNKGATTLGSSNTVPSEDTPSGSGFSAQLETRFVGIGIVGKLAAGNIFVGSYVRTEGTNGVLSFGRDFSQRPVKLKGYMKYVTAPISSVSSGFEYMKNQPDTCIIWCSLIDQNEPFEIRTNPSNRQLFDSEGSYVVAYGKTESGESIGQWTPFEFELEYKSTSRVPKYILITASASKYGDYFTGGNGAILWIDDLQLVYDY